MKPGKYKTSFLGKEIPVYYVTDQTEAESYISRLKDQREEVFGIDTETSALPKYRILSEAGLSPHLSKVRLLQVYTGRSAFVFDIARIGQDLVFKEFIEGGHFVGHNSVFDLQYFYNQFGVNSCNIGCTYLLSKLIIHATTPTDAGLSASLKNLVSSLFKVDLGKEMQVSDWSEPELTWEQVEYSALDAVSVYHLADRLAPKIKRYGLGRIYKLYKEAQHPIAKMQLNGIKLNVDSHRELISSWRESLYTAKRELTRITGLPNITSTVLGKYLEAKLPPETLAIWPRTETGKLCTDAHVFADFDFLEVVKPFTEYQKREKLCTAFGTRLINQVNPETNKLHPSYRLAGARTGRLSCSSPNLQQCPRDKLVRNNFIPTLGTSFVICDYSSVEVRAIAELSNDKEMLNAFENGLDIYKATAAKLNRKKIEDVTKEERQKTKCLVLGLQFGLGSSKLGAYARRNYKIEISDIESKRQVQSYRDLYPGLRKWQLDVVHQCAENNFTASTPTGKLRKFESGTAYGNVMNHYCQGGCAEVMLKALVFLNDKKLPYKIVGSVHDEIILEVPVGLEAEAKKELESSMLQGYLSVFPSGRTTKNLVTATSGDSWATAKG